ncbi:DUF2752 domain-containing protein [Glycomyces xiaoerkulensis]|uniref:DUF2752 domain-containing protein n=1 Tax=Glycomyces xiaoerkulensis TaxID=2038139 RepID=UPI0018E49275|nr:DUF2752 domain-containing protein [Glycomyces xiaoerkulensis]
MCAVDETTLENAAPRRGEGAAARLTSWTLSKPWLAPVAVLGGFALAAAAIVAADPTDDTGPTTCLFKMTTGFDCPGCGGTRAFYYLVTADLPEAARHHAMAVFAAPFLVWMFVTWALPRFAPKVRWRLPRFHLTPGVLTSFLIAWGVFFVARNLPWEPFTYFYV